MSKFYNGFDFIGELAIPSDDSKFFEVKDNGKGWLGHRLNFGIKETRYNSEFVELYGGYMNKDNATNRVYTFSKGTKNKKGSPIQVPWEDRLDKSTLDMVADFVKIIVDFETDFEKKEKYMEIDFKIRNLEYEDSNDKKEELARLKKEFKELATNRYEFIHPYDAILFISSKLKDYTDYKVRVKGKPVSNEYNGKYYKKYEPELIELVPEHYDNKLKVYADIHFLPSSVESNADEDGKIYVDGYIKDYVRESKKDELFPQTFVINTAKLDTENEKHMGFLNFIKGQFETQEDNLYHLPWEINLYRGAEVIESEDALTETQKQAIEFGLAEKSDYDTTMFGENIEEYRLVKPILKGAFDDGAVDTGYTEDEAMDLICKPSSDVKLEDAMPKEKSEDKKEVVEEDKVADVMEELFG